MKSQYKIIFILLLNILFINLYAYGDEDIYDFYNNENLFDLVTKFSINSLNKSQGIVEIRIKHLDGSLTYSRGSGFLVDKNDGFIVTSAHIIPDFKAVIEDDHAISFYKIDDDNTFQNVHAYVYATSPEYGLAILRLEENVPKGMEEVTFAEALPLNGPVYARIHRPLSSRTEPLDVGNLEVVSFRGRMVEGTPAPGMTSESIQPMGPYIFSEPPVEFFGSMVVDDSGRVVGMGNGIKRGYTALTSAPVIQSVLAEAHEMEQKIVQRGGITPSETHTIKQLAHIFEQIMRLYATQALERPRDLRTCAYEMFAMRPSGHCRDAFSAYLPPTQARQRAEAFDGNFGGIGLRAVMKQGMVEVLTPFRDTPAARAGIKPGDILKEVDGQEVKGVAETAELLRGPPGTEVMLAVSRKGDRGELQTRRITLLRELMTLKTVTTQIVQGEASEPVGMVTIHEFRDNTADQFEQALEHFQNQHIEKLVVDIRNNPGGSFRAAVRMLALFMEQDDTVLVLRQRQGEHTLSSEVLAAEYSVHKFGTFRNLNLVILINSGSASAAEIFAGTLQDWGYPVVGGKSFGKGVAQSPVTLGDDSMLMLTMFEFSVGNNRVPIMDKGVVPNVVVKNVDVHEDAQLKRALELVSTTEHVRTHGGERGQPIGKPPGWTTVGKTLAR